MSKQAKLDAKKWDLEVSEWDVKRLSDMRGIVGLHVHTAKAGVG